jgi:hypothetical protein
MTQATFVHRMQAVLQRRFGAAAATLAQQQWKLFQQGAFARQEDWLKEDCILATYDRLRADHPAARAWQHTCDIWTAYAQAVRQGRLPASWWFAATEIPRRLRQLTALQDFSPPTGNILAAGVDTVSNPSEEGKRHAL